MTRHVAALLLAGAWLLLRNPKPDEVNAPLADWKKVRSYDTALLCEQGRREKVADEVRNERALPVIAEGRYRCERAERVPGK